MKIELFTNKEEEKRRLKICKGCPSYRKDLTFLWIFKLKGTAQCAECKCPVINKITVLNPHCKKHD